ncbi:MAG: DUF2243 domain-containing protein [Actinomycetota bacterium]|nr:DUF2243 domain-containing protein [Actinomycetota bacterium]
MNKAGGGEAPDRRRELTGYVVLGVGVGALIDGFVLHQLLQWHHLVSSKTTDQTVSGLETNTLADGIFHSASLVVLLIGVGLLLGRRLEPRPLIGLALVGWGVFNVVDQLLFHLALEAHHIREGVDNYLVYDWGFFALGIVLIAVGSLIARRTGDSSRPSRSEGTDL